jgi:transposase
MEVSERALLRYTIISPYLAQNPPRGRRTELLRRLADKDWELPDGRRVRFSAETLRAWVRRYRQGGLEALEDRCRASSGVRLTPEQVAMLCKLKEEVPERSLDRILHLVDELALMPGVAVSRSTLHRVLQDHGLSGRPTRSSKSTTDLDRFEASSPNDIWQSDMLAGPWLPDPARPGKRRRAWLVAFLDDHSRMLLAGRFSFKENLPALELVFREALRRHGIPRCVYFDNGKVYRNRHMDQVVATLGIHRLVYTTPYRPQGHGKIEAFNRFCRAAFLSELKASSVRTLDELNDAFRVWQARYYNQRTHGETQETPRQRWRTGLRHVRYADETLLRQAFLWRETRKTDKTGRFSLFGVHYQTGPRLAQRKVEVRYDPEDLDVVEIWFEGAFCERVRPFEVQRHRRPRPPAAADDVATEPAADFLAHLRAQPTPVHDDLERFVREREAADAAFVDVLERHLSPEVLDRTAIVSFLERFGPFDAAEVEPLVVFAVEQGGHDPHIRVLLEGLQDALRGGNG